MIRSLAVGFGAVTMLAVAGSIMPIGQAMLGTRHSAIARATPATVIQDRPARVPAPVAALMAPLASTPRATRLKSSLRPRPHARPAASTEGRPHGASAPLGHSFD